MEQFQLFNENFFKSENSELDSGDFAKKYLAVLSEQVDLHSSNNVDKSVKIGLAQNTKSLETLVKRLTVISDYAVLSHRTNNLIEFSTSQERHRFDGAGYHSPEPYGYFTNSRSKVDCDNLPELGVWLKDCRELLTSGSLMYLPRVFTEKTSGPIGHIAPGELGKADRKILENQISKLTFDPVVDFLAKEKNLAEMKRDELIDSKYIKHIASLRIPVIESISMSDFSKITADEKDAFDLFRNFIKQKLLEIDESKSSEFHMQQMEKIALELEKGIMSIKNDVKRISKKRVFSVTGATMASVVATLVMIDPAIFSIWAKIVGGGGGLYLFWKALEDVMNEKDKMSQNQSYYLWLLEEKSTNFQ